MDSDTSGSSGMRRITRREIFDVMKTQSDLDINGNLEYAEYYLISLDSYSEDEIKEIKRKLAIVKSEIKRRWLAVKSTIELFEKKNKNWLNGAFDIPKKHLNAGRPQKSFEDASERSKTEEFRKSDSPNKIIYAAQMELKPAKSDSDKLLIQENKERIQHEFKRKLGLRVDFPKSGFCNSNDGNTSRRFFDDPELAAEITGIDVTLIKRFKIILECISSGFKIHKERFDIYTKDTAELYIKLYNRHPMTPTSFLF